MVHSGSSSSSGTSAAFNKYSSSINGYSEINNSLRSVLMSPVAVALFEFLQVRNTDEKINDTFGPFMKCLSSPTEEENDAKFGNFFMNCYIEWWQSRKSPRPNEAQVSPQSNRSPTETTLTKTIAKTLNESLLEGTSLFADDEYKVHYKSVVDRDDSPGQIDTSGILVYSGKENDSKDAVLLVDVGFNAKNDFEGWWATAHQGMMYAKGLMKQHNHKNNMLYAVLTIDKDKDLQFRSALFGVFLCMPAVREKEDNIDFRMALLWHKECNSLQELSIAFGRLVRATRSMTNLNAPNLTINVDYEYLGPNCCRMGNVVFRAYDSRFRRTHRNLEVYLDPDIVQGTEMVVEHGAANHLTLQHDKNRDNVRPEEWLWNNNEGGLTIISTPFVQGRHWAESPAEFVPIVKFLARMHEKGYVHADIRAFNMVIGSNDSGCLIDFDMSGLLDETAGTPKYPANYQNLLYDGRRMGKSGKPVTKWDDWAALLNVIFDVHHVRPLVHASVELRGRFVEFDVFTKETKMKGLPQRLIGFLKDICTDGQWTLKRDPKFEKLLCEYGFKANPKPNRVNSDPGCGTPPKKPIHTL